MGKSHKRMPFFAFVREMINLPRKNDEEVQVMLLYFSFWMSDGSPGIYQHQ